MKKKLFSIMFLCFSLIFSFLFIKEKEAKAETPTVTFKGIAAGWNNANFGTTPGINHLILSFGQAGVDFLSNDQKANAINQATALYDAGLKVTINGTPFYKIQEKFKSTHIGYDHGNCFFFISYPVEILQGYGDYLNPTIHIEEGTKFMDSYLPEVTLKFIGDEWIYTSNDDFKVTNSFDYDPYSLVEYPHKIGNASHALMAQLPMDGVELRFNFNTGNFNPLDPNSVFILDGVYKCSIHFYLSASQIHLGDNDKGGAVVEVFYGFNFKPNTDYILEIKIDNSSNTKIKVALNHLLVIDHEFSSSKRGNCDIWSIDTSNSVTLGHYDSNVEPPLYSPTITYGGQSIYDFNEGDSLYDFRSLVGVIDLFNDNVDLSNVSLLYDDGAVTNSKYNRGIWNLTISFSNGDVTSTKVIKINVHGIASLVDVYFEDNDPIKVEVGSLLTPPINPEPYRVGENDYIFDGWMFNGARWDFSNYVVQGEMHLIPSYKEVPRHYNVVVNFIGIDKPSETYSLVKGKSLPFSVFEMDGARTIVYKGDDVITSLVVNGDIEITVKYEVIFRYIDKKDVSCTEDGNLGYWYSEVYGNYYFADEFGKELMNPIIPKLGHNIIHLNPKDSSCSEFGNIDCFYCTNCEKHFSDSTGSSELLNWYIEKKPHDVVRHEYKDATCTENGCIEHYTCKNEEGVYYLDLDCSQRVDSVVIPLFGHDYNGAKYTWNITDNNATCTASLTCENCNNVISETKACEVTIIRNSTCTTSGQVSYFARFESDLFNTQTKIVNSDKAPHDFIHFDEVTSIDGMDGVKEHFECSICHSLFIKENNEYKEVTYSDLAIKPNSDRKKGCKSLITLPISIILIAPLCIGLYSLKRKEEK